MASSSRRKQPVSRKRGKAVVTETMQPSDIWLNKVIIPEVVYDLRNIKSGEPSTLRAIQYINACGFQHLCRPKGYCPRLVRLFYQGISIEDDGNWSFDIEGYGASFTRTSFARMLHLPASWDELPQPTSVEEPIVVPKREIIDTFLKMDAPNRSCFRRTDLPPWAWLVDHILINNVYSSGHSHERRPPIDLALWQVVQNQFLNVAALIFFDIKKAYLKVMKNPTSHDAKLYHPSIIQFLIEASGFPVPDDEERVTTADLDQINSGRWKFIRLGNLEHRGKKGRRPGLETAGTHRELLQIENIALRDEHRNRLFWQVAYPQHYEAIEAEVQGAFNERAAAYLAADNLGEAPASPDEGIQEPEPLATEGGDDDDDDDDDDEFQL